MQELKVFIQFVPIVVKRYVHLEENETSISNILLMQLGALNQKITKHKIFLVRILSAFVQKYNFTATINQ